MGKERCVFVFAEVEKSYGILKFVDVEDKNGEITMDASAFHAGLVPQTKKDHVNRLGSRTDCQTAVGGMGVGRE